MTLLLLRYLGPLLIVVGVGGKFWWDAHEIHGLQEDLAQAHATIKQQSDAAAALVGQVQDQNQAVEGLQRDVAVAQAASAAALAQARQGAVATAQRVKMLETARARPGKECDDARALIEASILGAK